MNLRQFRSKIERNGYAPPKWSMVVMTRKEITDAAIWHRAKPQGLLAMKLQLTNRGGIQAVDDFHLVVRLKSRLTAGPMQTVSSLSPTDLLHAIPHGQTV
ncbi:hypothetical protein [Variovorax sp. 54]|uniref:hypothetical protein n=1 Tax=Variovorax sp. 54 TaxID=2035212 RepID=UPI00117F2C67|nr:hypothetical protein [Variovorax sp. 54]